MAGETIRAEAICLSIRPWSRTSHVVTWLTREGRIASVVRGAERKKSFFLGQYDLNYTCDIVYYARARGELHALRECAPLRSRDALRGRWRALAFADYARSLVGELSPGGVGAGEWFDFLERTLDGVADGDGLVAKMVAFELEALALAGLKPDFSGYDRAAEWSAFSVESGSFSQEGRCIRVSRPTAEFLLDPRRKTENPEIPLDAARVIGVFYAYHLALAAEVRRATLRMISSQL